jgi:uncharacterized RDD family membrane protein YckC
MTARGGHMSEHTRDNQADAAPEAQGVEGAPERKTRLSIGDLPLVGRVLNRYVAKLIDVIISLCLFVYEPFLGAVAGIVYILASDGFRFGVGGQSVGKRLSGKKVVSLTTGEPAGFAESMVRNAPFAILLIAYLLIGWIPYVGKFVVIVAAIAYVVYEVMQMNVDGLRLGDRLARTRVIDVDEVATGDNEAGEL